MFGPFTYYVWMVFQLNLTGDGKLFGGVQSRLEILSQRQSSLLLLSACMQSCFLPLSGLVKALSDYTLIGRLCLIRRYVSPVALAIMFPPPWSNNSALGCWSKAVTYHQDQKSEWDGDTEWGKHKDAFCLLMACAMQVELHLPFLRNAMQCEGCTFCNFWNVSRFADPQIIICPSSFPCAHPQVFCVPVIVGFDLCLAVIPFWGL